MIDDRISFNDDGAQPLGRIGRDLKCRFGNQSVTSLFASMVDKHQKLTLVVDAGGSSPAAASLRTIPAGQPDPVART